MDSSDGEVAEEVPGLVDVTRLPLAELLHSRDPAVAGSLRRLLADLDRSQEGLAPFTNYV